MRLPLTVLVVVLVPLLACAGTRLRVQVEAPDGKPQAGAEVHLAPPHEICALGGATLTDAAGTAQVAKEYCGELELIVGAAGHTTAYRTLDTCGRNDVRVRLQAAPVAVLRTDECGQKAQQFLGAWASRDPDASTNAFVSSEAALANRRSPNAPVPWQVMIDASLVEGEACEVAARLFYAGCVERWKVSLRRVDASWRVDELVLSGYAR